LLVFKGGYPPRHTQFSSQRIIVIKKFYPNYRKIKGVYNYR